MQSNFHLFFYLKRQKNYQSGPDEIYMRITIRGKRSEISVGRDCDPEKWNSRAGRCTGTKESVKALNDYLDTLAHQVRIAHQQLIDKGKPVTAETLRK
jgi:hypothetical protein